MTNGTDLMVRKDINLLFKLEPEMKLYMDKKIIYRLDKFACCFTILEQIQQNHWLLVL